MIVRSDALRLPFRDGSVDLVVTSPPYFGLRSYSDGKEHYAGQIGCEKTPAAYVDALLAATVEMVRVLKPEGSIFVNLGDKYTNRSGGKGWGGEKGYGGETDRAGEVIRRRVTVTRPDMSRSIGLPEKTLIGVPWRYALGCIDRLGLILRAEIIWSKPNGMPESVTDRVRRSHESWFHFAKQRHYFSAIDEIRQEAKLPSSVWTIATEPLTIPRAVRDYYDLPDHYAAFPSAAPVRFIAGWSPPGGVVLDPFGGTGTVAMVAREMGRVGISADLSADYCRLAEWRVYKSEGGRKALAKARKKGLLRTETLDFGGAA